MEITFRLSGRTLVMYHGEDEVDCPNVLYFAQTDPLRPPRPMCGFYIGRCSSVNSRYIRTQNSYVKVVDTKWN